MTDADSAADSTEAPAPDDGRSLPHQHRLLLQGITDRLKGEFADLLPADTLEHYVQQSYDERSRGGNVRHCTDSDPTIDNKMRRALW